MKLEDYEKVRDLKHTLQACYGALTHMNQGGRCQFQITDKMNTWRVDVDSGQVKSLYQERADLTVKELEALGVIAPKLELKNI